MKLFKLASVVALVAATALPTIAAAADKPVVGLVMKSLANDFFKNMLEGAEAHAKKRGDYELKAIGMQNETDFESQLNGVENFITQGVDAIVIAPADSRAMVAPLKKAIDAGITVVNFDVSLDEQAKKDAGLDLAFVGPDNRGGAKLAGESLAKALGEGGKVVIIEGNPGADNAAQRKLGFEDAIAAGKLNLLDSRTAHWETEEANSVFSTMLTAHPDIQGVMAANDSMAIGVIKALDAAGRSDIKVVGFDNVSAVQPLLKEGKLLATVDQFGSQMASDAIDKALAVVGGGPKLEGWVKTDIKLVTTDDVK
ncbi:HTH-type transcriptional repressor purR Purine nucleotide synthesis repressor; Pur regulon repressor [Sinorhizobium fredii HH103]|uniref:HTH-type transcriptional repressor purR Purine nucleotide synthesis repressor Pur regulon repressor n=1 Tax=Sinorhizobium fredii (strain HH103) TaxID=1117943 RepID=G9A784_SINF1|nr:sugar ABC transporter substrate-binding protein [Sinorhizobium fredii]CCE96114.1 HTH-type transcriptional repressor purR Purine nucleotide synthesis repressor; Pur regulon repressor [Sinorhizobium fredii HH103]